MSAVTHVPAPARVDGAVATEETAPRCSARYLGEHAPRRHAAFSSAISS